VPEYPIRRGNFETDAKGRVMETVAARVQADYDDVSTMDGVRVGTDDGWFLVRASGTQPMVRVTAEARDDDRAESLFETARSLVDGAVGEQ
jgi:phosphoglucosamine mutase